MITNKWMSLLNTIDINSIDNQRLVYARNANSPQMIAWMVHDAVFEDQHGNTTENTAKTFLQHWKSLKQNEYLTCEAQ